MTIKSYMANKVSEIKMGYKAAYQVGMERGALARSKKGFSLKAGAVFGAVIALVLILSLVPTVNSESTTAQNNSTGAAATMYSLVPLVFAAGLIIGAWKMSK